MAAPAQEQAPQENEVEQLFQNVGQGLGLIGQYVSQAAPEAVPMVEQLLQGYDQVIQVVTQARQGGGGQQQAQPQPQEAGAARTEQAF
tara:strand:- start:4968 stop:5231 length:264 start_codon:yes stop_codon:yes gene_type:complete